MDAVHLRELVALVWKRVGCPHSVCLSVRVFRLAGVVHVDILVLLLLLLNHVPSGPVLDHVVPIIILAVV